jgi:hypothetical protein
VIRKPANKGKAWGEDDIALLKNLAQTLPVILSPRKWGEPEPPSKPRPGTWAFGFPPATVGDCSETSLALGDERSVVRRQRRRRVRQLCQETDGALDPEVNRPGRGLSHASGGTEQILGINPLSIPARCLSVKYGWNKSATFAKAAERLIS